MSFKELEGQLARWLERDFNSSNEFEIIYRKGELHHNADGLSRRPCLDDNYNYCAKVEKILSEENTVARIILENDISEEWRKDQLTDSVVSVFLKGKESNKKPLFQDLASLDSLAKVYLFYWNALFLRNGLLYKKWESPNSKSEILQVVPCNRINQILIAAYDSPSGGHFGINKILDKVRKRFYRTSCKQDVEN